MSPILGENVPLQFYKDGDFQDFACITDCSIEFTTESKEVRTIGDGPHRKTRGQRLSYNVSGSGLIELQESFPVAFWLLNYQQQMLHVQFRMLFEDPTTALVKIVEGTALVIRVGLNAGSTGFAVADFEMEGDGAAIITDSATVCNATIGLIEIGPGDPDSGYQASVNYTGVTNAARLEYSIDGDPREVIFNPGSNGFFFLSGLSDGTHTITVWTVCESGVDGESNELTFEITGGGAAPACAAPGIPVMSDITATSATATWTAASPAPAGGYFWEVRFMATDTLLSSGYTSDLFTNLTGLTDGVDYYFRVKSLCEEGVSESSWQRVDFTAEEPATCNVPGSPVMSNITDTTATATWTAPSPAPADGYEWEVRQGVTLIATGTTALLTVDITGLSAGTSYIFQVKSICETGVSESGYNSVTFDTTGSSSIDWAFVEDGANGTLTIKKNGITVVSATTTSFGNFTAEGGDTIQITAVSGGSDNSNITVDDITASTQIINSDDTGTHIESFVVTAAHDYSITVTISPI